MTLPAMRTTLRTDLKDLDPTKYLWTNDELDRHINRALAVYQNALPLVGAHLEDGDGSTRRFDISSADGYLSCLSVEYPLDASPPSYRQFIEEYPGTILILAENPPESGTENIRFWYAKAHTLSDVANTIPTQHQPLVLQGAGAYATMAAARWAATRLNASQWTPRHLRDWAALALADFNTAIAALVAQQANRTPRAPNWD